MGKIKQINGEAVYAWRKWDDLNSWYEMPAEPCCIAENRVYVGEKLNVPYDRRTGFCKSKINFRVQPSILLRFKYSELEKWNIVNRVQDGVLFKRTKTLAPPPSEEKKP